MTASLRLGRLFFPDSSDEQYSFHSTKMIQIGQTSCLIFLVRLIKRNVTSGDPEQRQHLSYHPLSPDMCLVGILEWARPEDLFGHPGLFHRSQQHVCATEALGFLQEIFGDHSKNNCTVIYDLVANWVSDPLLMRVLEESGDYANTKRGQGQSQSNWYRMACVIASNDLLPADLIFKRLYGNWLDC